MSNNDWTIKQNMKRWKILWFTGVIVMSSAFPLSNNGLFEINTWGPAHGEIATTTKPQKTFTATTNRCNLLMMPSNITMTRAVRNHIYQIINIMDYNDYITTYIYSLLLSQIIYKMSIDTTTSDWCNQSQLTNHNPAYFN